ncbi:putative heat repeat protein [Erysiphe necator]|uniref:Putative heat repeat protein n=1 Tax=Uncinula necator TaxID=52586 RepID=A0A0B1P7L0_UNCNE|nr:putative heat repeat protein [Erysiphe necator]
MFDLMAYSEISPTAGKFLVTIFRQTRDCKQNIFQDEFQITSWQVWIARATEKNPGILEDIKNYLLPPLFNLDRQNSLDFLRDLSKEGIDTPLHSKQIKPQLLLRLVAFEIGKKTGLIDEIEIFEFQKAPSRLPKAIVIEESFIDRFLAHADDLIRSVSFSILVSSSSPLRPFNPTTIQILQSKLNFLFADTDIKFRNEILSTTKQLIERLRGSSAFLVKEIKTREFQLHNSCITNEIWIVQAKDLLQKGWDLLQSQRSFIEWLFEFLIGELIPTASYQRHIISLKAINLWLSSGIIKEKSQKSPVRKINHQTTWPFFIEFFIPEVIKLLIDLLVDPFEDVRILASNILKMASPVHFRGIEESSSSRAKMQNHIFIPEVFHWSSNFQSKISKCCSVEKQQVSMGKPLSILEDFIEYVEEISNKTGRADYADGLARSYELLYFLQESQEGRNEIFRNLVEKLKMKIDLAENNLTKAVQEQPLHGILAALNLFWENSYVDLQILNDQTYDVKEQQNFLKNCVHFSSRIWFVVKHILCDDSPEGLLLEGLEELDTVDTKDILSYSFRAIHESSNLLRTVMKKSQHSFTDYAQMSTRIFTDIGNLSFEELSCLRHRGAFSTVSLTFAVSCKIAANNQSNLLNTWLERAFICLQTQISTTRRSAGIPSIITAIISAIPRSGFEDAIVKLLQIAKTNTNSNLDQERLPQVHALNSLKEIFKSVTTSAKVGPYISGCLEVVGLCLNSQVWAIRNSALILLRSLIDHLIGTSSKNDEFETGWDGTSTKIQYEKYRALPHILMQLLRSEDQDLYNQNQNHTVLPALSIIQRAGIPHKYLDEFKKILFNLLGSKQWHLREQGARMIMALQDQGTELETIQELIKNPGMTTNCGHGSILTAKLIMLEHVDMFKHELVKFNHIYCQIFTQKNFKYNPFILNEYMELANATLMHLLKHPHLKTRDQRHKYIKSLLEKTQTLAQFSETQTIASTATTKYSLDFSIYCRGQLKHDMITSIVLRDKLAILRVMEQALSLGSDIIISVVGCILPIFQFNASENAFNGILQSFKMVLGNSEDSDVVCAILDVVPQIVESAETCFQIETEPIQYLIEKLENFITIATKKSSRLLVSYYEFSGFICFYKISSPVLQEDQKNSVMRHWVENLKIASKENQEFDLRYAVTKAIQKFYRYYQRDYVGLASGNYLSELNFILMTLLIDDDDEIRKLAALIYSDMNYSSVSPLAALDGLFKLQITEYCDSKNFGWHCIQNLLVFDDTESKFDPVDPGTLLRLAYTDNYSLFTVEEPNLFSDPCRTQDYFASAFLRLPFFPKTQIKLHKSGIRSEFSILLKWASIGLQELQKQQFPPQVLVPSRQTPLTKYRPTNASIFTAIRRILVCGKTSLVYWQNNLDLILGIKKDSNEGQALIDSWELQIEGIKNQLNKISVQPNIHASLRRLAAK